MLSSNSLPPLQLKVSRQAQQFAHQCSRAYETPAKRQQVYLNTLAITVVNDYLEQFDIITALEQSSGWQVECQALDDTADLVIPGFGRLACRPVLANAESCYLSAGDHIGCVAVQFDFDQQQLDKKLGTLKISNSEPARNEFPSSQRSKITKMVVNRDVQLSDSEKRLPKEVIHATLVGFTEVAANQEQAIPLSAFQDFTYLFAKLSELQVAAAPERETNSLDQLLRDFPQVLEVGVNALGDWLEGTIESSWQTLELLLNQPDWQPATVRTPFAVRSTQTAPLHTSSTIERCKVLTLNQTAPLALIVAIEPKSTQDVRVTVELWPIREPQLPDTLEFQLLNESRVAVMQAQAHGSSHLLFTFSCDPGNIFDLKVVLDQTQVIESFVI